MGKRTWFALIGLCLSLLASGCAASGANTDDEKHPVFYGGVVGGGSRP